jgi:hypothetical protein
MNVFGVIPEIPTPACIVVLNNKKSNISILLLLVESNSDLNEKYINAKIIIHVK